MRAEVEVGLVRLIQADRVGDKNGFLSLQPSRRPTLSNLWDGGVGRERGGGSSSKVKSCDVFRVDGLKGSWREIRGCY